MADSTSRRGFLTRAGMLAGAGAASFGSGRTALAQGAPRSTARPPANPPSPSGLSGRALREAHYPDLDVTYFNHASMGTIPRRVIDARCDRLREMETNPWLHVFGGKWDEAVQEARTEIAAFFGSTRDELAITRTTTEAMHILAAGLPMGAGDEVLFPSTNHIGAAKCFEHWGARRGYTTRRFEFPMLESPNLSAPDVLRMFADAIREETRLLVLPHIDNLVGMRYPIGAIVRAARDRGVEWIAVDGAQAVGCIDVDVVALDVDFYATSAHKWIQSPKGFGLLHVRQSLLERVEPMMVTWGQARWGGDARKFEDYGTHDYASVLALGEAVRFQQELGVARARRYRETLRQHCEEAVGASDSLVWRSPRDPALVTPIVAVEVRDRKSSDVFDSVYPDPGFVFRAFATDQLNTMRLSFNMMNEVREIDQFFEMVSV